MAPEGPGDREQPPGQRLRAGGGVAVSTAGRGQGRRQPRLWGCGRVRSTCKHMSTHLNTY